MPKISHVSFVNFRAQRKLPELSSFEIYRPEEVRLNIPIPGSKSTVPPKEPDV
jgi:hypothetical protein